MYQVHLGEIRWRMLRIGMSLEIFCYHDLRQPSRSDTKPFDFLLDLGLFEPAPAGATATRRNDYRVKVGDPLGLFVVTAKGRAAAHLGLTESAPVGTPKVSPTVGRRPADESAPWCHAATAKPPERGTLFRRSLFVPPAVQLAREAAAAAAPASPAPETVKKPAKKPAGKPKAKAKRVRSL